MALADLTFKLYTDSNLSTSFSGLFQLVHNTDQSDNPQDFQLFLGSTASSRTLEASSSPGVDNIVLTPTYLLGIWEASTAYSLGDRKTPTVRNGFVYEVVTAGTTDASEPTWPTSAVGDQVVDGSVTWELKAAEHPITELKLATTSGGLAAAVAGDPLTVGTQVLSGVANAFEFHMRVTNSVTTVTANTNFSELGINVNEIVET